jgi:alkylated DNA repair protein (DNA oxidative demethylase)
MQLFDQPTQQEILKDVYLLSGFVLPDESQLLADLAAVIEKAPLRNMVTPRGLPMSVQTTSCGALGWVSDRKGYRYSPVDPINHQPWPQMPQSFRLMAGEAAAISGFANFEPDACLINRYPTGAKMGLHQDKDEQDFTQPIVSVSLGVSAVFQMGGLKRSDKALKFALHHGDVLVWGREARLRFHGVLPVKAATHPMLGACRINLTFRRAA